MRTKTEFWNRRDIEAEYEEFSAHPEKFPYYPIAYVKYPSKVPYGYGITNIPRQWYSAADPNNHVGFLPVMEGIDPKETKDRAKEMCELMNKSTGCTTPMPQ